MEGVEVVTPDEECTEICLRQYVQGLVANGATCEEERICLVGIPVAVT